eukprot:SAG22_NODE_2262_length_2775_cov_1.649103_1_plen_366_part_00
MLQTVRSTGELAEQAAGHGFYTAITSSSRAAAEIPAVRPAPVAASSASTSLGWVMSSRTTTGSGSGCSDPGRAEYQPLPGLGGPPTAQYDTGRQQEQQQWMKQQEQQRQHTPPASATAVPTAPALHSSTADASSSDTLGLLMLCSSASAELQQREQQATAELEQHRLRLATGGHRAAPVCQNVPAVERSSSEWTSIPPVDPQPAATTGAAASTATTITAAPAGAQQAAQCCPFCRPPAAELAAAATDANGASVWTQCHSSSGGFKASKPVKGGAPGGKIGKRQRSSQKLGRWWRKYGYDGPRYCQRCADTFSNHVMRELLANQGKCSAAKLCRCCEQIVSYLPAGSMERIQKGTFHSDCRSSKAK